MLALWAQTRCGEERRCVSWTTLQEMQTKPKPNWYLQYIQVHWLNGLHVTAARAPLKQANINLSFTMAAQRRPSMPYLRFYIYGHGWKTCYRYGTMSLHVFVLLQPRNQSGRHVVRPFSIFSLGQPITAWRSSPFQDIPVAFREQLVQRHHAGMVYPSSYQRGLKVYQKCFYS